MVVYIYTHVYTYTCTHTHVQWISLKKEKKIEIMPCAATWMEPEIIILSEANQIKVNTM